MPREGEVLFGIDRLNDGAERDVFVSGPGDWAVGFFANCERAFEFDAEPGAKFVVVGEGAPDAGDGSIDFNLLLDAVGDAVLSVNRGHRQPPGCIIGRESVKVQP